MPKVKLMEDPEVKQAIENAKLRQTESLIENAKKVLQEYADEYEHAKDVFFAVTSAKRILKNRGQ